MLVRVSVVRSKIIVFGTRETIETAMVVTRRRLSGCESGKRLGQRIERYATLAAEARKVVRNVGWDYGFACGPTADNAILHLKIAR